MDANTIVILIFLLISLVILCAFFLRLQRAYLAHKARLRTYNVLTAEGNYWTWTADADDPAGQDLVRHLRSRS